MKSTSPTRWGEIGERRDMGSSSRCYNRNFQLWKRSLTVADGAAQEESLGDVVLDIDRIVEDSLPLDFGDVLDQLAHQRTR